MNYKIIVAIISLLILSGCGATPIKPVSLSDTYYEEPKAIAVYVDTIPSKAKMTLPGASCLLCFVAADAANSKVSSHVKTLSTDEFSSVIDSIQATLQDRGMTVHPASNLPFNQLPRFRNPGDTYARRDHRLLKNRVEADHLLVMRVRHVGVERTYANYVPTSSPQGVVLGELYIVDLASNQYYLYLPLDFRVPVNGEWSEPPKFPGVTMAYYEAIERAKLAIHQAMEGAGVDYLVGEGL